MDATAIADPCSECPWCRRGSGDLLRDQACSRTTTQPVSDETRNRRLWHYRILHEKQQRTPPTVGHCVLRDKPCDEIVHRCKPLDITRTSSARTWPETLRRYKGRRLSAADSPEPSWTWHRSTSFVARRCDTRNIVAFRVCSLYQSYKSRPSSCIFSAPKSETVLEMNAEKSAIDHSVTRNMSVIRLELQQPGRRIVQLRPRKIENVCIGNKLHDATPSRSQFHSLSLYLPCSHQYSAVSRLRMRKISTTRKL